MPTNFFLTDTHNTNLALFLPFSSPGVVHWFPIFMEYHVQCVAAVYVLENVLLDIKSLITVNGSLTKHITCAAGTPPFRPCADAEPTY